MQCVSILRGFETKPSPPQHNREKSWNESVNLHVKLLVCASDRFHLTCPVVVSLDLPWHGMGEYLAFGNVNQARNCWSLHLNIKPSISEAPPLYSTERLLSYIPLDFVLVSPEMLVLFTTADGCVRARPWNRNTPRAVSVAYFDFTKPDGPSDSICSAAWTSQ